MSYKPKYCCQCGEKIERVDWKLWTSRRFCELCETEFGIYEWTSRAIMLGALLFGFLGLGFYLQKPEKQLNVAARQMAGNLPFPNGEAANRKTAPQAAAETNVQMPMQSNNSVLPVRPANADLKIKLPAAPPAFSAEKTFFCGAMTKKGTMCSRRVKGGGRCWQHSGQEAMLPQEKLIAGQ